MSGAQHTAGPWLREGKLIYTLREVNGFEVNAWTAYFEADAGQKTSHAEVYANATLAQAAPDLLAALEAVLVSLAAYRKRNNRIAYNIAMEASRAEEAARAAIAKAKGAAE